MTQRDLAHDPRRRRAGYVFIVMALSASVLFGMLGLGLDIGHVFIGKNEAQTYTDSASVSAALRLDGSIEGVQNAESEVANAAAVANRNAWNLSTARFPAAQTITEFSTAKNGPWLDGKTAEGAPTGIAFVRVRSSVVVPLFILPVVVSANSMNVAAATVAGQVPAKPTSFPFTPMAHNPADTINFGFTVGQEYTFRWGAGFKNGCAGDQGADPFGNPGDTWADTARNRGGAADIRGYWGDGGSASIIRQEIVDDYPMLAPSVGQQVPLNGGDKNTEGSALIGRINQDYVTTAVPVTDPTKPLRYYGGNGRRLIVMPVSDPHNNNVVLGYRAFLLLPGNRYNNGGGSDYCAAYIGSYNEGSTTTAALAGDSFKTRIVQ